MRVKLAIAVAGIGVCLAGTVVPVVAHHAFGSEFDGSKPITVTGAVTKMQWVNPHVWVYLNVKNADGTVEDWAFEAGSPNALFRRGFSKEYLKPGVEVKIEGFRSRDGTRRANGFRMTFLGDGKTLFMGSSGTGAPYDPEKAQ